MVCCPPKPIDWVQLHSLVMQPLSGTLSETNIIKRPNLIADLLCFFDGPTDCSLLPGVLVRSPLTFPDEERNANGDQRHQSFDHVAQPFCLASA